MKTEMPIHVFTVIVREEYVRDTEVYNRPGVPASQATGWEASALPLFAGAYPAHSRSEAIQLASADTGIVEDALLALI